MTLATSLLSRLSDPSLLVEAVYVGGEWTQTAEKTFDVTDPATGEVLATLPALTTDDTRRAISAAKAAQGPWARRTGKDRSAVLKQWHQMWIASADDLARILTAEQGKPLAEAKGEILYGAAYLEWFAEEAKRIYGDLIPGHAEDVRIMVMKQPVGVVGAITPWNFPNAMIARKVAPALAVGCAMVVKPATETPLSIVFHFDTVQDAIDLSNDTEFGLATYFYARDMSRVIRVAEALESGIIGVNTGLISTEVAPFGGVKQSGLGREGSRYGADDYLEIKYVCLGGLNKGEVQ